MKLRSDTSLNLARYIGTLRLVARGLALRYARPEDRT